jgi:uncharacterized protein (DUF1778 family)
MKELDREADERDINARLDQTMIGLDPEAFALVVRWLDQPVTEAEAAGYRRLKQKARWANDPET